LTLPRVVKQATQLFTISAGRQEFAALTTDTTDTFEVELDGDQQAKGKKSREIRSEASTRRRSSTHLQHNR
jgi:hypothetical protein